MIPVLVKKKILSSKHLYINDIRPYLHLMIPWSILFARISFIKGVWMVGVIDEIRISVIDTERYATLVDTKTRVRAKLPAEPQQRNGRYFC